MNTQFNFLEKGAVIFSSNLTQTGGDGFFFLGPLSAVDEPMFRVLATVLDIHAILLAENIHCWFGRAHGIC